MVSVAGEENTVDLSWKNFGNVRFGRFNPPQTRTATASARNNSTRSETDAHIINRPEEASETKVSKLEENKTKSNRRSYLYGGASPGVIGLNILAPAGVYRLQRREAALRVGRPWLEPGRFFPFACSSALFGPENEGSVRPRAIHEHGRSRFSSRGIPHPLQAIDCFRLWIPRPRAGRWTNRDLSPEAMRARGGSMRQQHIFEGSFLH